MGQGLTVLTKALNVSGFAKLLTACGLIAWSLNPSSHAAKNALTYRTEAVLLAALGVLELLAAREDDSNTLKPWVARIAAEANVGLFLIQLLHSGSWINDAKLFGYSSLILLLIEAIGLAGASCFLAPSSPSK